MNLPNGWKMVGYKDQIKLINDARFSDKRLRRSCQQTSPKIEGKKVGG